MNTRDIGANLITEAIALHDEGLAAAIDAHALVDRIDAARDEGRRAVVGGDWVLVPREPTEAMTRAWWQSHFSDDPVPGGRSDADAYRAMLAAAPSPVTSAEPFAWAWRKVGDPLWQFDGNREFPPLSPPDGYEQKALYDHPARLDRGESTEPCSP